MKSPAPFAQSHENAGAGPRVPCFGFWLMFLVLLGCFGGFLVLMHAFDLPRLSDVPQADVASIPQEERWKFTRLGRQSRLDEFLSRERAAASTYAWIDGDKGIVRLPIKRAMELTVLELNVAHSKDEKQSHRAPPPSFSSP